LWPKTLEIHGAAMFSFFFSLFYAVTFGSLKFKVYCAVAW